ncbi:DUF92 domain-containing protein [Carnobacterium gallinarum]|uniref:DUF92 domain-containing protein n=1 Tax=Carnobacterium gallinarum TaxID=2749 RepID=UPI00054E17F3|nr:DUF92 domain-containing protein [Carnobacterium gallinarum]
MNLIGILVSFGYVFFILLMVTFLQKIVHLSEEFARKAIHILVGNWIFIALYFFDTAFWAGIVPLCFIVLNFISYQKSTFKAMERRDDHSLGTVWYAVSLFILTVLAFSLDQPYLALSGILAMTYGDGFAAVIGSHWGNVTYPAKFGNKSLEGTVTGFLFIYLVTMIVAYFYLPVNSLLVGLICGIVGTLLELLTPNGLDNLSLPLGISGLFYLFSLQPSQLGLILIVTLTISILFFAWLVGALTVKSCWTAFLLGTSLYVLSGWLIYTAMIIFAILGSGISKVGRQRKAQAASLHEREGTRGSTQVLANGFPAFIFALLFFMTKNKAFQLAALTSFAAANADTFSSEIGMLSGKNPYSILTLKPLAKGLSGGVSKLGLVSGLIGSILIGLLALGSYPLSVIGIVIGGGFFGTLLDSFLGSTLQAKYTLNEGLTEQSQVAGSPLELASGFRFITNDGVNFISVICSSLIVFFLLN